MKCGIRVAAPPPKPLMVFDGDCNFCTLWIRRWQQMTGDSVDYLPAQDPRIAAQFPEIPREQFDTAVQLIEPDGSVYSGAEAVFRALAHNPRWQWPRRFYETSVPFADFTEWAYRLVAGNRTFFSLLTRWFWGRHVEQPAYFLTRWFFLRALGVIYLLAFVSLWTQISGLIGHNGILPTDQFMAAVGATIATRKESAGTHSFVADVMLDQCLRRISPFPMRSRNRAGCVADFRHRARAVPRFAVAVLSVADNGGTRFSRFSMGQSAARNRFSCHLLRATTTAGRDFHARNNRHDSSCGCCDCYCSS